MKNIRNRSLLFGAFCILTAFAFAYTTGPCETTYPKCDLTKAGIQCGKGQDTISFGEQENVGMYYCGGNTSGRCGGPNSSGTCSELYYRAGTARKTYCGENLLGYCFDWLSGTPLPTGHDCGLNPCLDVPAAERITPNIIGETAPCNGPHGTPCYPFPTAA